MAISNVIAKYLKKKIGAFDYKRGWLKSDCPFCGGSYKFGYHPGKDLANCFRCPYVSKGVFLVKELEKFHTVGEVYSFLKTQDFSDISLIVRPQQEVSKPEENVRVLPEGFKLLFKRSRKSFKVKSSVEHYLTVDRGLSERILRKAKVGFCTKGPFEGFIIFPVIEKVKVIYFQGRNFQGDYPKFKNPPEEDLGVTKSNLLYNRILLKKASKVYIVESIINVLTLDFQAVAGFGKTFNRKIISELIQSPVKEFIIALDPDAVKWAITLGLALVEYKEVKILEFPEGKDVNDVGKDFVHKLEAEAEYETYSSLIIKKQEYEYNKETDYTSSF